MYKLSMWEKNQLTLKNQANFSGIGLHSGIKVEVTLEPANSNSGILFRRTDLEKDNEIVANFKNVSSAKLCTKIENSSGASVSTIEHLMAAFYICGIDNIIVNLNGPEVPIMDGSAKDFVKIIKDCGFKVLEGKRKFVRIKNKIELKSEDGKSININRLFNIIKKNLRVSPQVIKRRLDKFDPKKSSGKFDKLNRFLNIKNSKFVKLEDGITKTILVMKK